MDPYEFAERIFLNLPYDPNEQQISLIAALARFCTAPDDGRSNPVFLLNGYAGTGKTSLTGALVRALREIMLPVVLMAPTGRAAKVFGNFAGFPASTIHRRIYRSADGEMAGSASVDVAENTLVDAVFIIDEASMIGDGSSGNDSYGGRSSLLEDLIHYVYSGDRCRMILLGDTAQLPPVACSVSPAMDPAVLRSYGLKVSRVVLTKVVRQEHMSGILYNATWLRRAMRDPANNPMQLTASRFADVTVVDGVDLEDSIASSYGDAGEADTLVITASNRRAVAFNRAIRANILYREEELCRGERLMVVKNNYLFSARVKGLDFIANGDMAVVETIHGTEEIYGFRFADVTISLPDRDISLDVKLLLDTLASEAPALEHDRFSQLYERLLNDPDLFTPTTPMRTRMRMLRSDPYLNALQVKYAYAVTCHKAQGGQWPNVYVDLGFMPAESDPLERLRWLYTAVTRATSRLFITGASEDLLR
ncbi:MAG: AAA family ATPase [Paramuribaculum sp.]